jgi:hypothetical protein
MCPDNRTYVVYGATLGQGWQGVESLMSPDYESAGFQFQLDVELPIYVEYVVSNAPASCFPSLGTSYVPGTTNRFPAPELLQSQDPWFKTQTTNYHNQFKVVANGIGEDPYENDFSGYTPCPDNTGIASPQITPSSALGPLTTDGKLRVADIHGGTGRKTTIILERRVTNGECGEGASTKPWLLVAIILSWTNPGCELASDPDLIETPSLQTVLPGQICYQNASVICGTDGSRISVLCPKFVVEWPSADFAGTTPGIVDASDLSVFSQYFPIPRSSPTPLTFEWGGCGDDPPNWMYNISPYDGPQVEAADLSRMAAALQQRYKGAGKAGDTEGAAEILTWFGIASTGRHIIVGPDGDQLPEYAIVNMEQNRRAILDPYCYRRTASTASAASKISWTVAKQLYR